MPIPPQPTGGIITSEPIVPGDSSVTSPFNGSVGYFSSQLPPQGPVINWSGVVLDKTNPAGQRKIEEINQMGAYQVEPYEEDWQGGDCRAIIHWRVPWNNNARFRQWALGYSWNQSGVLHRIIPASHPKYPWLYCVAAKLMRGDGAVWIDTDPALIGYPQSSQQFDPNFVPVEMIAFYDAGGGKPYQFQGTGQALWQLTYQPLPYAVISDDDMVANNITDEYQRYCERIETYAVEQLPIPGQRLVFSSGPPEIVGQPIDSSGVLKRIPTRALIYRWHEVPDVPEDAFSNIPGSINATAFDLPWTSADGDLVGGSSIGGFPPGTLLCEAPKKERRRNAIGRVVWTLEFTFLFRGSGWNNFPAADGNFYPAEFVDSQGNLTGKPLFGSAELRRLFQLPTTSRLYQNTQF